MKTLLYVGAVCGIISAVIGAFTHDGLTVALGLSTGALNYVLAEIGPYGKE